MPRDRTSASGLQLNRIMSIRYQHRFLIPAVVLSLGGMTAVLVKYILTRTVDAYDIVIAACCLAGIVIVCADRRHAYRRITFRNFTVPDHVFFWLLLKLSCSGIVIGLLAEAVPLRLAASAAYLLFTVLIRSVLVRVKRRNAYSRN